MNTAPAWATCCNAGPLYNEEVELISFYADENLLYEFDEACVVKFEGMFYLLHTSGCSCPLPEDNAIIYAGPYASIRELIHSSNVTNAPDTCIKAVAIALANLADGC